MTIRYNMTIETNPHSGERQLTSYRCDDGHFVGNTPQTFEEQKVVAECKELARIAGSGRLEIRIMSS